MNEKTTPELASAIDAMRSKPNIIIVEDGPEAFQQAIRDLSASQNISVAEAEKILISFGAQNGPLPMENPTELIRRIVKEEKQPKLIRMPRSNTKPNGNNRKKVKRKKARNGRK